VVALKADSPIELYQPKWLFPQVIIKLVIKEHSYYSMPIGNVKVSGLRSNNYLYYSNISNMCFAIPGKVIKIKGKIAFIEIPHYKHQVDASLLKKVKIGDYLLVHQKMAINKIPKSEAQKILKLKREK